MGKFTVEVNDELEEKFRKTIAETKGFHKGDMGKSLEEALDLWIKEQEKRRKK